MKQQDAFALGRSDLNSFLFADIGVEVSGMPLSVVSALARQGLDPWQEAGRLAKLPRKAATECLSRLIAAMPASIWQLPEATTIATRLVALLPGHDDGSPGSLLIAPASGQRSTQFWLIAVVLTLGLLSVIAAFNAPALVGPAAPLATDVAPPAAVPTKD